MTSKANTMMSNPFTQSIKAAA
jgi:hypothetical protein